MESRDVCFSVMFRDDYICDLNITEYDMSRRFRIDTDKFDGFLTWVCTHGIRHEEDTVV